MRLQRGVEDGKLILPSRSGVGLQASVLSVLDYYAIVTTFGIAPQVRVIPSEGALSITKRSMIDVLGDGDRCYFIACLVLRRVGLLCGQVTGCRSGRNVTYPCSSPLR